MDANEVSQIEPHEGKKGVLTLNDGSTVEGTLAGVTPFAIVFNPKGGGGVLMKEPTDVKGFEPEAEKPKVPKSKKMKPIDDDKVLQHLLDRHGVEIRAVVDQPVEALVNWHDSLHAEYVLGHHHDESPAEQAVGEAESGSDTSETQEPVEASA